MRKFSPAHSKEILEAVWALQQDSPDPVKFAAVRERLASTNKRFRQVREKEIAEWVEGCRRFVGELITVRDDVVALDGPPWRVIKEIRSQANSLPEFLQGRNMYLELFTGGHDE